MIPSWLEIALVSSLVAFVVSSLGQNKDDIDWFRKLRRPSWLTFEGLIPFIWIFVFTCGIISASLVRPSAPQLMSFYLAIELAILAFNPVTCKLRSPLAGAIVGIIGFLLGVALTIIVFRVSTGAGILLLPYLLWSPIGSFVAWQMSKLNHEI